MEPHTARSAAETAAREAWGRWLRARMDERGLSTRALAGAVGVSHAVAQAWTKGTYPGVNHLLALADALDVGAREIARAAAPP